MNNAGQVRARNTAGLANRHPVLRERNCLSRLQKRVRLLISEETRLQLDISAIVVGKRLAPIESLCVNAPGPNLFRRQFRIVCKMRGPRVRMRIPDTHKILAASMYE